MWCGNLLEINFRLLVCKFLSAEGITMDLLNSYGDEDDVEVATVQQESASTISSSALLSWNNSMVVHTLKSDIVAPLQVNDVNCSVEHMFKPSNNVMFKGQRSNNTVGLGSMESVSVNNGTFDEQYRNFQRHGYAMDVHSNQILGDINEYNHNFKDQPPSKKKKTQKMTVVSLDSSSPWEPVEVEKIEFVVKREEVGDVSQSKKLVETAKSSSKDEAKVSAIPSIPVDYTWFKAPAELKPSDGTHDCFVPKKCLKKYTGHTKGIQEIELFPKTGHLILSASLDGTCKIWDVFGDRTVHQTYLGHNEAVRSINFDSIGSSFISSSFDKSMKLWDVATGKEKQSFTNKKMNYQARYIPYDDNLFISTCADNRLYQWDIRTGQICQEYNYHLAACNAVLFFDKGRKFISTSDDKKILVWETEIPVPILYIQEQDMHSTPSVTIHPSGDSFAAQSMNNTIVTYFCGDKVKQNKKKTFRGHLNSGYACQIGFSPNGKYMMSGDGKGKLHVWDWKSMKKCREFQAHDNGPCMGAIWHPIIPSYIITCGWDGVIKLWD